MEGFSTPRAAGAENGWMEKGISWPERRDELVVKLVQRATDCPGLYPFRSAADFLRVAHDEAGDNMEQVCRILERMWQRPEEAVQLNAQSLIRRGSGWKAAAGEKYKRKTA